MAGLAPLHSRNVPRMVGAFVAMLGAGLQLDALKGD